MRSLTLNLARRPFTNDALPWLLVMMLSAGSVGLMTWNGIVFVTTGKQLRELVSKSSELEQRRRADDNEERRLRRQIEEARSGVETSRGQFANTIIQERTFSWTELFNELERQMPMGVRLINVRPRQEDGIRVRIDGVARDTAAFWTLQENLEASPFFGSVYPDVVQPATGRAGLGLGERLVSVEFEYFPDARRKLGLPEEAPPQETVALLPEPAPGKAASGRGPTSSPTPPGGAGPAAGRGGPAVPGDQTAPGPTEPAARWVPMQAEPPGTRRSTVRRAQDQRVELPAPADGGAAKTQGIRPLGAGEEAPAVPQTEEPQKTKQKGKRAKRPAASPQP